MAQQLVGRVAELAQMDQFMESIVGGPCSLLLTGDDGIGKSALWKEGLARALQRGYRVSACRPVESEVKLSFTGLADLFDHVFDEVSERLPLPQRSALGVTLLRQVPETEILDQRAVARATLGLIRVLSEQTPFVVAVDDAQWLDPSSARVLRFALRRLEDEPVGVLLAAKASVEEMESEGPRLYASLPEDSTEQVAVGPLGVDALGSIIEGRLGSGFLHPTVVQIHRASGGNPFFALEIARALKERGSPILPGDVLPVPERVRDLVSDRLSALSPGSHALLRAVAAHHSPTIQLLERALGDPEGVRAGLTALLQARIVELEGDRILFVHPLHASVAYGEATKEERRRLHRLFADAVVVPEERARHLALGAKGPDASVAAALDAAALEARKRGAPDAAAELSELARRLTPSDQREDAVRRSIRAAEGYAIAGDAAGARRLLTERARALLDQTLAAWPAPRHRDAAAARAAAIKWGEPGWEQASGELFRVALRRARGNEALQAVPERGVMWTDLARGDLAEAARHAQAALALGDRLNDPTAVADALAAFALLELSQESGIAGDVFARASGLQAETVGMPPIQRPGWTLAVLLKWTGELEEARARFEALHQLSRERGEEALFPGLLFHVSEVEWRLGDWVAMIRHAEEGHAAALRVEDDAHAASFLGLLALVHAYTGNGQRARAEAEQGRWLSQRAGGGLGEILGAWALGSVALCEQRLADAHHHLEPFTQAASRLVMAEPLAFRFLADDVEALVGLGQVDLARPLVGHLEAAWRGLGRNWAIAAGMRCGALIRGATEIPGEAVDSLAPMIEAHEKLHEPFELGRALLVAGAILRRAKERRQARRTLERAAEVFDRLGAHPWSQRAKTELARIGGRAPTRWDLTTAERRLAELVAEGKTNQEIAATLYISINTVQSSLRGVYRKLGLRSRTELARKIMSGGPDGRTSSPSSEHPRSAFPGADGKNH